MRRTDRLALDGRRRGGARRGSRRGCAARACLVRLRRGACSGRRRSGRAARACACACAGPAPSACMIATDTRCMSDPSAAVPCETLLAHPVRADAPWRPASADCSICVSRCGAHPENAGHLPRAVGVAQPEAGAQHERLLLARGERREAAAQPGYEVGQRALRDRLGAVVRPPLGRPAASAARPDARGVAGVQAGPGTAAATRVRAAARARGPRRCRRGGARARKRRRPGPGGARAAGRRRRDPERGH